MPVELRLDPTRLERFADRLGLDLLRRRAERVAALARVYAAPHGSISVGIEVQQSGPKSYKVISTNPHSLLVHNGSRPHPIFPRRRGGVLRFEVGGRVVFARAVRHPGYKGDPYLLRALRDAG